MSRSSRRKKRMLPVDVVAHSPRPFDDSQDLPEVREGVSPPAGETWLPSLPAAPSIAGAPRRLPAIVSGRGMGPARPHAKPVGRDVVVSSSVYVFKSRLAALSYKRSKTYSEEEFRKREKRRLLFNALAVPFSRRARFCIMRKVRRQVLFALRKKKEINPRSPGGGGTYRRRYVSQYAC